MLNKEKKVQPTSKSGNDEKPIVGRSVIAHRCSGCGAKAEIYNERWDLYVCHSPNCKPDDIMRDWAYHAMTGQ